MNIDFENFDWQTKPELTFSFLMSDDTYEDFACTLQTKDENLYEVLKESGIRHIIEYGNYNISPERTFMDFFMDTVADDFGLFIYEYYQD